MNAHVGKDWSLCEENVWNDGFFFSCDRNNV